MTPDPIFQLVMTPTLARRLVAQHGKLNLDGVRAALDDAPARAPYVTVHVPDLSTLLVLDAALYSARLSDRDPRNPTSCASPSSSEALALSRLTSRLVSTSAIDHLARLGQPPLVLGPCRE